MRIVRFLEKSRAAPRWGWVDDQQRVGQLSGSPFAIEDHERQEATLPLEEVRLLAPVQPTKVIGVGRNYPAHAAEHKTEVPKQPLLFLKPPSAVIGPGEAIHLPPQSQRVEHEAELAAVIGREGRWIEEERALEHVLGYTVAIDVTARDLQRGDPQWTRGKGFDTFCPLGPWIETDLDLARAQISCSVNGELRQRGTPSEMVFSVAALVAFTSTVMTLRPGDAILTGTPSGVGPLLDGDEVTVTIEGIGTLVHPVRTDPTRG